MVTVPIFTKSRGDEPPPPPPPPPPYSETPKLDNQVNATVNIHPLASQDGVIVKIQPPKAPANEKLFRAPCDIALVIDVSGSMGSDAPVPGEGNESTGLSVLDLVKHACRTIMSTMSERDRLAIVTFSNGTKVLQPLNAMTDANKETAKASIEKMRLEGSTNLWHGLRDGIKLFEYEDKPGRVPAVMVLTDGAPNHMCPPQGYVPALRAFGNIIPSIHTFGFGYSLRSGLLKSISEFGGGNYSFIPDAGMIGTVFVHAVANLQSTFANNATLQLTYPDHVTLEQSTGASVDEREPVQLPGDNYQLSIPLGTIQYGQDRDIYLRWKSNPKSDDGLAPSPPHLNAVLQCTQMTEARHTSEASRSLLDISTSLSDAEIAYHISRSRICAFLAGLFPIDALGEHRLELTVDVATRLQQARQQLAGLIDSLPASAYPQDAKCASLLQDLSGREPLGQISLALSRPDYFTKWGQHYLPSLHGAHVRQLCNSFKDPGPLQYGADSPLFIRFRDALSNAFDNLPAPTPSNVQPATHGHGRFSSFNQTRGKTRNIHMGSYNSSSNPCFAGRTKVRLAGGKRVRISALRPGMQVATPLGPRRVAVVLMTLVTRQLMVRLEGVLVTPWHPVALPTTTTSDPAPGLGRDQGHAWVFPIQVQPRELVKYTGAIYSLLLQRDDRVDANAVMLGGGREGVPLRGVTLGHGMLSGKDVRAHRFFGSYERVVRSLATLRVRRDGVVIGNGVTRSKATGLVCRFREDHSRRQPHRALSSGASALTGPRKVLSVGTKDCGPRYRVCR